MEHGSVIDPLLIILIIGVVTCGLGGYFGWYGAPWKGPYYAGGLGLISVVMLVILLT